MGKNIEDSDITIETNQQLHKKKAFDSKEDEYGGFRHSLVAKDRRFSTFTSHYPSLVLEKVKNKE